MYLLSIPVFCSFAIFVFINIGLTNPKKINAKIKSEKWAQKRNKLKEKIAGSCEKKLEKLAEKAFMQLEDILNDEMASSSSKIQAAKMIIDLTGFKKETNKEVTYEVHINREKVKCK